MADTFLPNLRNTAAIDASIRPVSVTTGTTNGVGIDCLGAEGQMAVIASVGVITGIYTVLKFVVTESDDNVTFVAMTEAPSTIPLMLTNTTETLSFWKRSKRYVRVELTATSGTTALVSAVVLFAKKVVGTGSGVQL